MNNNEFTKNTIEAAIRLGLLMLLAFLCFSFIRPFVLPVTWIILIVLATLYIVAVLRILDSYWPAKQQA